MIQKIKATERLLLSFFYWKSGIERMKNKKLLYGILFFILCYSVWLTFDTVVKEFKEIENNTKQEEIITKENIWIVETGNESIRILEEGGVVEYKCIGVTSEVREKIATVLIQGETVIEILVKNHLINGKVVSNNGEKILLENGLTYEFSDQAKTYQLYGTPAVVSSNQIVIGYDYTDFVIEDGKIVASLIVTNQPMDSIRVLLMTSGFQSNYHEEVRIIPLDTYTMKSGSMEQIVSAGEEIVLDDNSNYFQEDTIFLTPQAKTGKITIPSIVRAQDSPQYRGSLTITKTEDGLVVVNELPLEEYLYAVVPSEMPASYPLEALKAQAICARTYAYHSMEQAGEPEFGAHVNDSTGYQVYQNIGEQEFTTSAVKETEGLLLFYNGELANTYYYSTSSGFGSDMRVWNSDEAFMEPYIQVTDFSEHGKSVSANELTDNSVFEAYIGQKQAEDFEVEYPYYRWIYEVEDIDQTVLLEHIKTRYRANNSQIIITQNGKKIDPTEISVLGTILSMEVTKRLEGGIIDEMVILTSKYEITIQKEYSIRYILGTSEATLENNQGTIIPTTTIVPSAFFALEEIKKSGEVIGYTLTGGGYGHGVGMSQNAAKEMALLEWNCKDILQFFFKDTIIDEKE